MERVHPNPFDESTAVATKDALWQARADAVAWHRHPSLHPPLCFGLAAMAAPTAHEAARVERRVPEAARVASMALDQDPKRASSDDWGRIHLQNPSVDGNSMHQTVAES